MPKDTKSFNKRATIAFQIIVAVATLLVLASVLNALTAEPANKTPNVKEKAYEITTEGTEVSAMAAAGEYLRTSDSDSGRREPSVVEELNNMTCLLVRADNGRAPEPLGPYNTLLLPGKICMTIIMTLADAVDKGELDLNDTVYHPSPYKENK